MTPDPIVQAGENESDLLALEYIRAQRSRALADSRPQSCWEIQCACGTAHEVPERTGVAPCGKEYDLSAWGRS